MNDFVLPVHDTSKLKYLFYHLFTYSSYYIIIRLYHYILLNIVFFYSPTTLKIHQSLSLPITISFHRHPLTTNHQNYHHQSTINLPSTILSSSISTNSHLQSPTYLIAVFIVSHNLMFFVLWYRYTYKKSSGSRRSYSNMLNARKLIFILLSPLTSPT